MITFNTESRAIQINAVLPTTGKISTSGKTTVLLTEGGAISPTLRYTLSVFEDTRTAEQKAEARAAGKTVAKGRK